MPRGSNPVSAFTVWGKLLAVRFVLALGVIFWVWILVYGGVRVAKWAIALNEEPPKYDFMVPPSHPQAIALGLALVAWPLVAGVLRILRYGWKIRVLPSARFENALLKHFAPEGWVNVREKGGEFPARGVPFTLGADRTVFASIEKTHRGRTVRIMYYGVAAVDGGDPLNSMYTIVAVFTDADVPVTMIYPQKGVTAVKAALGATDVNTESAEFNRRWRLVSREPRVALEVMQPLVLERLLRDDVQGLTIAWDANAALAVSRGVSMDFAAMERALDVLVDVADRMPAYQTKSGARGERVSQGSLAIGHAPKYRPGPFEVALGALGILVAFGSGVFAEMIVPIDSWALGAEGDRLMWGFIFFCAGVAVLLLGVVIGIARGKRQRRAWADRVNAER